MRSLGMAASVGRNTVSLNVPNFPGLAGSGVGSASGRRSSPHVMVHGVRDRTWRAAHLAPRGLLYLQFCDVPTGPIALRPEWVSSLGGPDADVALARIFFNVVRRLMRLSPERRA